MKIEKFEVIRRKYIADRTLGIMLRNGEFFGYTLEDAVRDSNIKLMGRTAIPPGFYELVCRFSSSKQRERVWVDNVPGFTNIQIHGGNSPEDTEGCILVAENTDGLNIWGSLESKITEIVENANFAFIKIVNLNQL